MPTTLVVETGLNVAGANSYVSLSDARAYCALRGLSLSAVDTTAEQQLVLAMDYLEAKRNEYQSIKTYTNQALQWPRSMVEIDGEEFPEDEIPKELIQAQIRLAVAVNSGIDIMPTRKDPFIIKDKTGPFETTYSEKSCLTQPEITAVDALLKPLLRNSSGFSLTTLRV